MYECAIASLAGQRVSGHSERKSESERDRERVPAFPPKYIDLLQHDGSILVHLQNLSRIVVFIRPARQSVKNPRLKVRSPESFHLHPQTFDSDACSLASKEATGDKAAAEGPHPPSTTPSTTPSNSKDSRGSIGSKGTKGSKACSVLWQPIRRIASSSSAKVYSTFNTALLNSLKLRPQAAPNCNTATHHRRANWSHDRFTADIPGLAIN